MYMRIDKSEFTRRFEASSRADSFSREALEAIFCYIEESTDDGGLGIELDIIAVACSFAEYPSLAAALEEYRADDEHALEGEVAGIIRLPGGGVVVCDG
jgi:hypothetical protein